MNLFCYIKDVSFYITFTDQQRTMQKQLFVLHAHTGIEINVFNISGKIVLSTEQNCVCLK